MFKMILVFFVAIMFAGCSTYHCDAKHAYHHSESGPQLVVPESLDEPSSSQAYALPSRPAKKANVTDRCLVTPEKLPN